MPVEINAASGFINPNQNSVSNNRAQLEREQQVRQQPEAAVREAETESDREQTETRRAQAVQQLESESTRVRRDDNSDLNFRAQQAVNRFNEVNDQQQRQDVSELLGIDIFA